MPQKPKRTAAPALLQRKGLSPDFIGATSVQRKSLPLPRTLPDTGNSAQRLCWRFRHADDEGPWSFHNAAAEFRAILPQLAGFESMTVGEVFPGGGRPGKEYEIEEIPNPLALTRLDAIGLADMTRISVLRLNGKARLYGFRDGNVFHVVWWDPRHEIWPSQRKHT